MHSKNSSQQNNLQSTSSGKQTNQIDLGYSNFRTGHTFSRDQTDFQESQSSDSDEESVHDWLSETSDSNPSEQIEQIRKEITNIQLQNTRRQITGIQHELQSQKSSSPSQFDMNDLPGKIAKLFKEGQHLGKGTDGEVKKVKINGTYFAVKRAYHNNNQVNNSLWMKEKEIPYLLKIYDAITMKNNASYIIMEYLDEKEWMTLADYRQGYIIRPVEFTCEQICEKLKDAIHKIHESDFYLLDINPDNIMIKIHSNTNQNNIEVKFIDYGSSIYHFQNINEGDGLTYFYKLPDYRHETTNVEVNKQYAQDRDLFAIHIVCLFLTAHEDFFIPILNFVDKLTSTLAKIFIEILYQNLLHVFRQFSIQNISSVQNYIDATFRIDTKSFPNIDENEMKTLLKQIFPSFYKEFKNSHFAENRFDYRLQTKK